MFLLSTHNATLRFVQLPARLCVVFLPFSPLLLVTCASFPLNTFSNSEVCLCYAISFTLTTLCFLFAFFLSSLLFFLLICYGGKAATTLVHSLDREFGSKLKEHMQYCMDHQDEISRLAKVQAQVSEVNGGMMENIEKVIDRQEKIDVLAGKTDNLLAIYLKFLISSIYKHCPTTCDQWISIQVMNGQM